MKLVGVLLVALTLVVSTSAFSPEDIKLLQHVASSFSKGFQRTDPWELSPTELMHAKLIEENDKYIEDHFKEIEAEAQKPPVLLQENSPEEAQLKDKVDREMVEALKQTNPNAAQDSQPGDVLLETSATIEKKLQAHRKPVVADKDDGDSLDETDRAAEGSLVEVEGQRRFLNVVKKLVAKGRSVVDKMTGKYTPNYAQAYEDCMGCRMVWKQVEMDVSNARYIEDVQASFEHNCMDAQKSQIFYKVCEDMYDDMYALTDDYMSGQYDVDKICQRAKLCINPNSLTK